MTDREKVEAILKILGIELPDDVDLDRNGHCAALVDDFRAVFLARGWRLT